MLARVRVQSRAMPTETIVVSEIIPATPDRLYSAWLSSDEHSSFTGNHADIDPRIGGRHSTFGGYAVGANVELVPGERIVQTWRTSEFPSDAPDSRVEVSFEETMGGTLLTIQHAEIPAGKGAAIADAWIRHYLDPMRAYYGSASERGGNGVAAKPKAKVPARATAAKAPRPKVKAKAKAKLKSAPKRR